MWPFDSQSASAATKFGRVFKPSHPYYPLEVEVAGYLANEWSVPTLLALFSTGCATIFGATYYITKRVRPNLPVNELITILWFVLCGFIHTFFEGYYAYNFRSMGGKQDLFGQLWKEYALSDSRYLTKDAFTLCMESITAICWGPLSFTVAYLIATQNSLRHPLQIVLSLGQLYGDVLYYSTSMFDLYIAGKRYFRPEPYYFWVYYFFMNTFWIVIPSILIVSSVRASSKAFQAIQKVEKSLKANGPAKKRR